MKQISLVTKKQLAYINQAPPPVKSADGSKSFLRGTTDTSGFEQSRFAEGPFQGISRALPGLRVCVCQSQFCTEACHRSSKENEEFRKWNFWCIVASVCMEQWLRS